MLDDLLALFPPEILQKIVAANKIWLLRLTSRKLRKSVDDANLRAVVEARKGVTFTSGKGLYLALTKTNAFCKVVTLSLRNCNLQERGASALADVLRLHNTVVSLDLSYNGLRDGGVRALKEVLWHNPYLESLILHKNVIGPEGWKDVCILLRLSTTLKTLSLGYNPEGNKSGQALAHAMLHNNPEENTSGQALAHAMLHNHTLTSLDLSFNNYDDVDGESLASALRCNRALTRLQLYCNCIRDRTGSSMARMLRTNTTLTSLNLRLSNITDNSGIEIAMAMRENTTLRHLDIGHSDMESAGEDAFAHMRNLNSTCEVLM